jgi:hypothetical protein
VRDESKDSHGAFQALEAASEPGALSLPEQRAQTSIGCSYSSTAHYCSLLTTRAAQFRPVATRAAHIDTTVLVPLPPAAASP